MKTEDRDQKSEKPQNSRRGESANLFGIRVSDFLRPSGLRISVFTAFFLCFVWSPLASTNSPTRTIGLEGHVTLELPRGDYRPLPLDDRTEFILRIGSVTPVATNRYRYELYYMGLEPEHFDLADYLIRPDGSRPDELAGEQVLVSSLLPDDHDGQLTPYVPRRFPFIGGYRMALGSLGVLWLGGVAAFVWAYRMRHPAIEAAPIVPHPTFAERLQPLVELAARGQLTTEQQAQIERLLMGFWREKLKLPEPRMADAIARLREHAQAGELLRALEHWLHQRSGASAAEVDALLEPYRKVPAIDSEGGAA